MDILLYTGGAILVLIVTEDVFFTVLFPASGRGLIRKPLSDLTWHAFRLAGKMVSGQRRRDLLSYSGPALISITLSVWIASLVIGWALIYKPALGTDIRASLGVTDRSWTTALYYSGYCLTTLGVGDLSAVTGLFRLLTVVEAAMGFAFFSMVITYFLSVYSNLTSRNAFAQGLHHRTKDTDDASVLLASLAEGSELPDARDFLSSMAGFLRQIYQTHRSYPVLRFFHYRDPCYALPRVLLTALDTATLLRSALDEAHYAFVVHSPALDELMAAALSLMHELIPGAMPRQPDAEQVAVWRKRYHEAMARLEDSGLRTRPDSEDGATHYMNLRAEWHWPLYDLAAAMLYEWDAIERMPAGKAD